MMKKFLGIIVLGLLLSGNAYSKDGVGPIKFTSSSYQAFVEYLNKTLGFESAFLSPSIAAETIPPA